VSSRLNFIDPLSRSTHQTAVTINERKRLSPSRSLIWRVQKTRLRIYSRRSRSFHSWIHPMSPSACAPFDFTPSVTERLFLDTMALI